MPPGEARGEAITIDFEGEPVPAFAGEPVAVALHAAGVDTLAWSSKYHRLGLFLPRPVTAPPARSASTGGRTSAPASCRRGTGWPAPVRMPSPASIRHLLGAADSLFPEGMDHHTMMTANRPANALFLKVVREMGGSGKLPDHAPAEPATLEDPRARCLCGGRRASRPDGGTRGRPCHPGRANHPLRRYSLPRRLAAGRKGGRGARGRARGGGPGGGRNARFRRHRHRLLPRRRGSGRRARDSGRRPRRRACCACVLGASSTRPVATTRTFRSPGNDRPGVIAARACGRLVHRWGVRPVAQQRPRSFSMPRRPPPLSSMTCSARRHAGGAGSISVPRGGGECPGRQPPPWVGHRVHLRRWRTPHAPRRCRRRRGGTGARVGAGAPARRPGRLRFSAWRVCRDVDARYPTSAAGVFACGDVTGYSVRGRRPVRAPKPARAAAASLAAAVCLALLGSRGDRGLCLTPASPPAATPPIPTGPPPLPLPSSRPPLLAGLPPRAKAWPTLARPRVELFSTPPGAPCATSTSIRSWAASIGRPSAPSTSRWPSAPRRTPRSIAC